MIDFLKVFAALLIILHHLSSYGQIAKDAHTVLPLTMAWLFEYKRYAVQIFLVMAGYLAAQSLNRLANMRFSASNFLKVIFNRYLRLFFPYAVALLLTIACAYIARLWINDEFVGESETLSQFLAHLFFIQGILGLDSISAGAWYIAIDWQLYAVLAVLLITFPRYQSAIWILSVLGVCSLLFFNRSGDYEAYFIYFIGSYALGALAFLAKGFNNDGVNRLARIILLVIDITILVSSFQQLWLRNILAWMVAVVLLLWGDKPYPAMNARNQKLLILLVSAIAVLIASSKGMALSASLLKAAKTSANFWRSVIWRFSSDLLGPSSSSASLGVRFFSFRCM